MKKVFFLFLLISCFSTSVLTAATITATGGEWTTAGSWDLGVPVNGDIVIIPNGVTITITGQVVTYTGTLTITIQNGGQLQINATSCGFLCTNQARLDLGSASSLTIDAGGSISNNYIFGFGGTIVIGGVTVWDPFVFGTGDPNPVAGPASIDMSGLPIELLFYEATKVDESTNLSWSTASEENFDYFEVQRAVGSTDFERYAEIPGAGKNVFEIREYSFTDEKPLNGINYYRLKAIDLDGTFEYSPIQSLKFDFDSRFEVYPNPTAGLEMNILIDDVEPHYTYVVYDNMGLMVVQEQILGGDEAYALPNLKPGIYLVKLIGRGDNPVTKLVVH